MAAISHFGWHARWARVLVLKISGQKGTAEGFSQRGSVDRHNTRSQQKAKMPVARRRRRRVLLSA